MTTDIIDKVAWLRIENKKVLMVRSEGKPFYCMPGGRRFANETDEQTLMHEIKEELDIYLMVDTMRFLEERTIQADNKTDDILVRLTFYGAEYYGKLSPRFEITNYDWLDCSDLDRLSPATGELFKELQEQGLIN